MSIPDYISPIIGYRVWKWEKTGLKSLCGERWKPSQLLAAIQPGLQKLDLSGGYRVNIGGEIEKSAETNQRLAAGLPAALAVMVIAIVLQFNSFRRALLTFISIPLIFVGIPYGLLLTGQPLSFFGTLGIISLAGIIINNAIVLIDQIDIERAARELPEPLDRRDRVAFRRCV